MNLLRAVRQPRVRHDDVHYFQGNAYYNQFLTSWQPNREGIGGDFATLVKRAYKGNSIVFACEFTRMALLSQARPTFRRLRSGRRGDIFGTGELSVLERPWPGGNFGSLAARMELDAGLGGTAFVARRRERPDRLMRMRPDWVTMVLGSEDDPEDAGTAMDADFLGIIYHPGGPNAHRDPITMLADEVAVWAPIPDPEKAYTGLPWPTAALREVESDIAATVHKGKFFENGATPGLVLNVDPSVKKEAFLDGIAKFKQEHDGVSRAYRTIALQGVTPHVVGKDFQQLDFKNTQGAGETRIAAASGVHPVVAALSEGMAGSSLNAGNFQAAKRIVADRTLRPLWASMFAALSTIVPGPDDAELWYAESEIDFLQEDRKDAAEIQKIKALTIESLVRAGYDPRTVQVAVESEDMTQLVHTGLYSVQLQPAGSQQPGEVQGEARAALTAVAGGARPKVLEIGRWDPQQPRDDDGQWSDGIPGPAGDPLKLKGRIRLREGESFGGSARVLDRNGDQSTVMARIDGPTGSRLRIAVVSPDDERVWRAENKGRTVEFDAVGAAELQQVLRNAVDAGKKNVAEYRQQLREARKAGIADDQLPASEADIASGVVKGGRWGDVHWALTREEGDDYGNYGPGGAWSLAIDPAPPGASSLREPFYIDNQSTANKFDKAIGKLMDGAGG